MATVNVPATQVDVTPPEHPDGGEWVYLVMFPTGELCYSDNLGEIVVQTIQDDRYGYLLDDDSDAAHDECLFMRYEELCDVGNKVHRLTSSKKASAAAPSTSPRSATTSSRPCSTTVTSRSPGCGGTARRRSSGKRTCRWSPSRRTTPRSPHAPRRPAGW